LVGLRAVAIRSTNRVGARIGSLDFPASSIQVGDRAFPISHRLFISTPGLRTGVRRSSFRGTTGFDFSCVRLLFLFRRGTLSPPRRRLFCD